MRRWLIWLIPAAILMGLIGWRFVGLRSKAAQDAAPKGGGGKASIVRVASATGRTILNRIEGVGNIESPYKIEVSPKSSGRIDFLQAREGDKVTTGQVLVKLDPSDLKGAVLQQVANVAQARARLAQAKLGQGSVDVGVTSQIQQEVAAVAIAQSNYDSLRQNFAAQVASSQAQVNTAKSGVSNAQGNLEKETATQANLQKNYDRAVDLGGKGYIPLQDVDNAKTAVDVQKSAVSVANGQVAAARSLLDQQQQNLSIVQRKGKSDIAASKLALAQAKAALRLASENRSQGPAYLQNVAALQDQVNVAVAQLQQAQSRIADTILRSSIDGTVTARKADPGALASPGTPILEVQYLDWVYVTATFPIDAGAQIQPGQLAQITIDALPGRKFSGRVTNINAAADPQSHQFGLKIRLENKDHSVRPGMYARVAIVTDKVAAAVVIPREALLTDSNGVSTVAVVVDGVAKVRNVKVGARDEVGVQILEGVALNDQVVVLTFNPLKDGEKVKLDVPETTPRRGKKPK